MADRIGGQRTDASGAPITSEHDSPEQVALTVAANDRLLKALISILSLRDPGMLEELPTVFALAARETGGVLGEASAATWDRIGAELRTIRDFMQTESPNQFFDS